MRKCNIYCILHTTTIHIYTLNLGKKQKKVAMLNVSLEHVAKEKKKACLHKRFGPVGFNHALVQHNTTQRLIRNSIILAIAEREVHVL
jgi:hypothetical protein